MSYGAEAVGHGGGGINDLAGSGPTSTPTPARENMVGNVTIYRSICYRTDIRARAGYRRLQATI